jgi:hypothetical protein
LKIKCLIMLSEQLSKFEEFVKPSPSCRTSSDQRSHRLNDSSHRDTSSRLYILTGINKKYFFPKKLNKNINDRVKKYY